MKPDELAGLLIGGLMIGYGLGEVIQAISRAEARRAADTALARTRADLRAHVVAYEHSGRPDDGTSEPAARSKPRSRARASGGDKK